MKKAKYETNSSGKVYGEIPELQGVWAEGNSVEECRNELMEVAEEWIFLKLRDNDELPVLDNLEMYNNSVGQKVYTIFEGIAEQGEHNARLTENNLNWEPLGQSYFEKLKKNVRYWDGEKFVNTRHLIRNIQRL